MGRMIYRFGVFEFDGESKELRKNGRAAALEPQPAKALALLLSRPGDVVSREELRDAVWGKDTHVDFDRGLAYCLSQIRTALGDSGDNPRFVQTVPKARLQIHRAGRDATAVPANRCAEPTGSPAIAVAIAGLILVFGAGLAWLVIASRSATHRGGPAPVDHRRLGLRQRNRQPEYDRPVAGLSDLVVERLTKLDPDRIAVIGNAAVLRQPRNIRNLKAVARGSQGRLRPARTIAEAARPACGSSRISSASRRSAPQGQSPARRRPESGRPRGRGGRGIRARGPRARPQPSGQLTDSDSDLDPEGNLRCPAQPRALR